MTDHRTGGCACGEIRYEARGEPVAQLHCQCAQCRKRSGTGHGSYLAYMGGVTVTGTPKTFREIADSGREKVQNFCGTCGSPVFVTAPAMPDLKAIHAASLDDPGAFAPAFVTFASAALPWDRMDEGLRQFAGMPPG